MQCKERLQAYLDERHVAYEVQQHRPAFSAQQVAESEHISGKLVAKAVIVIADGKMVMLVVPASVHLDFDRVYAVLQAGEARLAREPELSKAFPDCQVGTMPPFGNLYDIPVYVDSHLAEDEHIVFPAGTYTETMRVRYADFARLVNPVVANLARFA